MSVHKKTAANVIARHLRQYQPGDHVRILRGKHAGREMVIDQSANDWVMLQGTPAREVMSKGNVEPIGGFTDEELERAAKMSTRGLGV